MMLIFVGEQAAAVTLDLRLIVNFNPYFEIVFGEMGSGNFTGNDWKRLLKNGIAEKTDVKCPLCGHVGDFQKVVSPLRADYWLCAQCYLIFVDKQFLPSRDSEKERYQTHQNGPQYPGYVSFLKQALLPTLPYLSKEMSGLDYGCGPVPTLSVLLKEEGLRCDDYDPFFYPELPDKKYDFIFSTEAAEHFFKPSEELIRIEKLLNPGGILTIMTELWYDQALFPDWYYAKDFTHVSFYHLKTIDKICELFNFEVLYTDKRHVFVLREL